VRVKRRSGNFFLCVGAIFTTKKKIGFREEKLFYLPFYEPHYRRLRNYRRTFTPPDPLKKVKCLSGFCSVTIPPLPYRSDLEPILHTMTVSYKRTYNASAAKTCNATSSLVH
jgi:hypothetical protein